MHLGDLCSYEWLSKLFHFIRKICKMLQVAAGLLVSVCPRVWYFLAHFSHCFPDTW